VKIRIAGIVKESVVDGPGIRYVVFTQGCFHNCLGCHNPNTHDLNGGYEIEIEDLINDIDSSIFINGVTFSGGEPFLQAENLILLAQQLKKRKINIAAYTGYTFEEIIKSNNINFTKLIGMIDILIDGKFIQSQRDISLRFRGSKNQRVIDVYKSLETKSTVLLME
jgi:anaerobic ribonucleoside-triphosphate reductase activating protein